MCDLNKASILYEENNASLILHNVIFACNLETVALGGPLLSSVYDIPVISTENSVLHKRSWYLGPSIMAASINRPNVQNYINHILSPKRRESYSWMFVRRDKE